MGAETQKQNVTTAQRLDMIESQMRSIVERQDAILEMLSKSTSSQSLATILATLEKLVDGVKNIGEQQQYTTDTVTEARAQFDQMMSGGIMPGLMKGLGNLMPTFGGSKQRKEINGG